MRFAVVAAAAASFSLVLSSNPDCLGVPAPLGWNAEHLGRQCWRKECVCVCVSVGGIQAVGCVPLIFCEHHLWSLGSLHTPQGGSSLAPHSQLCASPLAAPQFSCNAHGPHFRRPLGLSALFCRLSGRCPEPHREGPPACSPPPSPALYRSRFSNTPPGEAANTANPLISALPSPKAGS